MLAVGVVIRRGAREHGGSLGPDDTRNVRLDADCYVDRAFMRR
jgi:hypothetical protein